MSQVRILSPRPLILIEFFEVTCLRFQIQKAHGSKNGSSFNATKSRKTSAVLGCQRTTRIVGQRHDAVRQAQETGAGARSEDRSIDRSSHAQNRFASRDATPDPGCGVNQRVTAEAEDRDLPGL